MPGDPSDEDLQFANQLGVHYVNIPTQGPTATYENFVRLKNKVESAGLRVWNIGNSDVHNMEEVTLNLPGRDRKIEQYKNFLRNLGRAGLHYTTYAHMGNGIWSSGRATIRGASGREFRARNHARWRARPCLQSEHRHRPLGRQGFQRPAHARPRLHGEGNLG
jgi:mannonate dehydratase